MTTRTSGYRMLSRAERHATMMPFEASLFARQRTNLQHRSEILTDADPRTRAHRLSLGGSESPRRYGGHRSDVASP
jgi:hypothetical protein